MSLPLSPHFTALQQSALRWAYCLTGGVWPLHQAVQWTWLTRRKKVLNSLVTRGLLSSSIETVAVDPRHSEVFGERLYRITDAGCRAREAFL